MNYAAMLTRLREQCAAIEGVKTCRIGLEAEITPEDYPIIRLVPTRLIPQQTGNAGRNRMELTIYYGSPLQAFEGLEAVYTELFRLEAAIRQKISFEAPTAERAQGHWLRATFVDTITDEDRLPHYKLFASRFEVEG